MDLILVLIVVLILVLVWRGPKTLPLLGKAFGQGVKEARKEMDEIKTDVSGPKADAAPNRSDFYTRPLHSRGATATSPGRIFVADLPLSPVNQLPHQ